MKIIQYLSVCIVFFLAGCSDADHVQVEKPVKSVEKPVKDDHIMSGYMKALEKAEEVQEKTNEAVARKEKAIEAATRDK